MCIFLKFILLLLCLISDPPPVLRVDDRQRLARERREEREKQLGSPNPTLHMPGHSMMALLKY